MNYLDRREFLRGSSVAAAAASLTWPADLMAAKAVPSSGGWDPGSVRHLLPTASHSRVLVKASFRTPLLEAPTLRIGGTSVRGHMTDTRDRNHKLVAIPKVGIKKGIGNCQLIAAVVWIGDCLVIPVAG